MDAATVSKAFAPPSPPLRAEPTAAPSELPPAQAVGSAATVDSTPGDTLRRRVALDPPLDREPDRDRRFVPADGSDTLVYRESEAASGLVLLQIPSREALKVRAYARREAHDGQADVIA